jgi:repressor LexA
MSLTAVRTKLKKQKPPSGLTPRQGEILLYLLRCLLSGYVPTLREIGDDFDIASTNGVSCHLDALRSKGYLEAANGTGITLTDKALNLVF